MKVFGAEVARVMRSAAARGEDADFVSATNGWSWLVFYVYRRADQNYLQGVQSFHLLHLDIFVKLLRWDVICCLFV